MPAFKRGIKEKKSARTNYYNEKEEEAWLHEEWDAKGKQGLEAEEMLLPSLPRVRTKMHDGEMRAIRGMVTLFVNFRAVFK